MKRKVRYYTKESEPTETRMFFRISIPVRIDLLAVARFLFYRSSNVDDVWDWEDWTSNIIIKEIKTGISGLGKTFSMGDPEDMEDERWEAQPEYAQYWFLNQAKRLFPEIDWEQQKQFCKKQTKN